MKIGIMGGTFDPPHYAHLILAEQAREQFALDRMLFMPSGSPPHKQQREGRANNEQRLMMSALAVSGNPKLELSDFEMRREGPSYSYLTLEKLREQYPEDSFYFIIGADSLRDFPTWREPARICRAATLLCATRNRTEAETLQNDMEKIRKLFHAKVELINTPNMDISSGMLREMIAKGQSVRYYLPDAVYEYILREGIYQAT